MASYPPACPHPSSSPHVTELAAMESLSKTIEVGTLAIELRNC